MWSEILQTVYTQIGIIALFFFHRFEWYFVQPACSLVPCVLSSETACCWVCVLEWRSLHLNTPSSCWRSTEWRVAVRTMEPNSKRSVKITLNYITGFSNDSVVKSDSMVQPQMDWFRILKFKIHPAYIPYIPFRLTSRKPLWRESEPVDISSQWRESWKSASVVNAHFVDDPTIRQLGFALPRQQWSLLNHFRTGQGHCGACKKKWKLSDSDQCSCSETQTMSHIVESCPQTWLHGGLSKLHSADDDAIAWLTSYGS